ncbi:hypothetical protein LSH36_10g02007 [Paralvinella palmiformis]|uniref:Glutathione S-transferase n=1 Tax=Paralvinella palmiformis TaxID=53620 RepID=A0AAD9KDV7_9ANNE|nr:hypothetical protein LSH36_10g02007 [Paralvinella palmiformis]
MDLALSDSIMTRYKLVYFSVKGRGELIRWILKLAEEEFEDFRFTMTTWPEFKPSTPFGQAPTLEIDGKVYCQSMDICRFLANKYGYNGDTLEEKAIVDMIVDHCEDMVTNVVKIFLERDNPERRQEMHTKYEKEELPVFLNNFEKLLEKNNSSNGWFVGDKMTWADLAVVHHTTDWMTMVKVTVPWDDYPLLNSLKEKVQALPQLQRWFKEMPQTPW